MSTIFITGANRGIGLEFVRQYASAGHQIYAGCRNPEAADELKTLREEHGDLLRILRLNLTSQADIDRAGQTLQENDDSADILINNAGCFVENEEGLETLDADKMHAVYQVNTVAPALLTKALYPALRRSELAKVINITSGAGVLWDEGMRPGGQYSYGATKAALNMITCKLAADLKLDNIVTIGMGPGFVLTDMTRNSPVAPTLQPDESVKGMIQTIEKLTLNDTGRFFDWTGEEQHWHLPRPEA